MSPGERRLNVALAIALLPFVAAVVGFIVRLPHAPRGEAGAVTERAVPLPGCPPDDLPPAPPVPAPWPAGLATLTDLEPRLATVGHGELVRDAFRDGHPLRLEGIDHARGLDAHAPSCVVYDLPAGAATLAGAAGLWSSGEGRRGVPGDEAGTAGTVIFRIHVDGAVRWESPLMRWDSPGARFQVDLTGARRVALEVLDFEDAVYDWSIWVDLQLVPGALRHLDGADSD